MATITSAQSGLASATTTWVGGVVPVEGDRVVIDYGHTVELDGSFIWGDGQNNGSSTETTFALWVRGKLKWSRTVNSSLTMKGKIGLLTAATPGEFDMGIDGVDEIPGSVTAELIVNKEQTEIANYSMFVNNGTSGKEPKVNISSAVKRNRNTWLTADVSAGSNTITVDNAANWQVGDTIVIAAKFTSITAPHTQANQTEEKIISAITGNTITLTTNLAYGHGYLSVFPLSEGKCCVSNVTSNCIIRSFDPNKSFTCFHIRQTKGTIDNAEFRGLQNKGGSTLTSPVGLRRWQYQKVQNSSFWIPESTNTSAYPGKTMVYSYDGYGNNVPVFDNNVIYNGNSTYMTLCKFAYGGRTYQMSNCNFFSRPTSTSSRMIWTYQQSPNATNCNTIGCGNGWDVNNNIGAKITDCNIYGSYYGYYSSNVSSVYKNCNFKYCRNVGRVYYAFPSVTKVIDCKINLGTYNTALKYTGNSNQMAGGSVISYVNIDQDPNKQLVYTDAGQFEREQVIIRNSQDSVKFTPLTSTKPMPISFSIAAKVGVTSTIVAFVRKSAVGTVGQVDLQISEPGNVLGIKTITYNNLSHTDWTQIDLTVTPTNTGVITADFVFSGDVSYYLTDVSYPINFPVNTGEFKYWQDGQPVQFLLASYVAASDVWSSPDGQQVKNQADEIHKLHGLDSNNPLTVSQSQRSTGTITQSISGTSTVTVQRT